MIYSTKHFPNVPLFNHLTLYLNPYNSNYTFFPYNFFDTNIINTDVDEHLSPSFFLHYIKKPHTLIPNPLHNTPFSLVNIVGQFHGDQQLEE